MIYLFAAYVLACPAVFAWANWRKGWDTDLFSLLAVLLGGWLLILCYLASYVILSPLRLWEWSRRCVVLKGRASA